MGAAVLAVVACRPPASGDAPTRYACGLFGHHLMCTRTMTSSVRKTTGFGRCPGDRGRTGTRCRRARAALRPGSQHGDLGHPLGRAEAVLDQPADVTQASQRPPRADEVAVDVGAIASDDVTKVLLVSEREGSEVEQRVALG